MSVSEKNALITKLQQTLNIGPIVLDNLLLWPDAKYTRDIYNALKEAQIINIDEQATLAQLCRLCETITQQRAKLSISSNRAQKESLIALATPFIEHIIECTGKHEIIATLLRLAFSDNYIGHHDELAQTLSTDSIELTVLSSCEALWKIMQGNANMENHLLRMDATKLPSLRNQRFIIRDVCLDMIQVMFSSLADTNQLVYFLSIIMFANSPEQNFSPLGASAETAVSVALTEPRPSQQTEAAFSNHYGRSIFIQMMCLAFSKMGILSVDAAPDIARIKRLQLTLHSPAIMSYLADLQQSLSAQASEVDNSLLSALKKDSLHAVQSVVESGVAINQYFRDGRTPLLYAIQNCKPSVVKTILRQQPNVNQANQDGAYRPLGAAIQRGEISILTELVTAGPNMFIMSGTVAVTLPGFPPQIQLSKANAYQIAIQKHLKNRSDASLAIVKTILACGGGIGQTIDDSLSIHLSGIVLIGSTIPNSCRATPVTTRTAFFARTPRSDWVDWKIIFSQAVDSGIFSDRTDLVAELRHIIRDIDSGLAQTNSRSHTVSNSDTPESTRIHKQIFRDAILILKSTENSFIDSLRSQNYNQALRRASTAPDAVGYNLICMLLHYEKELGIDVNEAAGAKGYTALHHAASKNNRQVYNLLVEHGANVNKASSENTPKTPVQLAAENGFESSEPCAAPSSVTRTL